MTSKERFLSAMEYKGYDRPPARYYGSTEITDALLKRYNLKSELELREKLGCDFRQVEPTYIGPKRRLLSNGSLRDGLWGEEYAMLSFGDGEGEYREAVFLPYKDVTSIEEMNKYPVPSPDWYDYSDILQQCEMFSNYVLWVGGTAVPDFINGISRVRGVEQTLMDIATEDPVFMRLMDMFDEFFYEKTRRTLIAAERTINVVCIGDDLGTQNGPLISPASFEKLFAKRLRQFIDLAHEYGAYAMMHSCGSVHMLIPNLIGIGLDILEVVQIDAKDMAIERLYKEFYSKIAFCGSISVQATLPFGTIEDVWEEVEKRKRLFKDGGMIIAPTHQIQVGTPLENIEAMYKAIGSFKE